MKECCRKYLCEQLGNDMEVINVVYAEYVSSIGDKMADVAIALRGVAKQQDSGGVDRLIADMKALAAQL